MPEFGGDQIHNREHIAPDKTGDNIAAKKVANYNWDPTSATWQRALGDTISQAVYDALLVLQPYQNAIPYARDINDQMRVLVSNQPNITTNAVSFWNNSTYTGYYGSGGAISVDPREQIELQAAANINATINRWTIT